MGRGFLRGLVAQLHNGRRLSRAIAAGNEITLCRQDLARIKLKIRGKGNVIRIGRLHPGAGTITISLFADNSRIEIGEGLSVSRELSINMGQNHPNFGRVVSSSVRIGEETSLESVDIGILNSRAHVEIGPRCMFSFGITLYQTDAHPIYELGTDRILNRVGTMKIGEHVWIGAQATLLKNVQIADGSLVGWGSVVSGRFETPHVIIAGNPARQIPNRQIDWSHGDPRYITNE